MTRRGKITLAMLSFGHFINDTYSSMIYPLLPMLADKLHLTTAQVFWLAPLYSASASLMQPVYGFISDRYFRRIFAVFGPLMTGVFISCIGLADSYWILMATLIMAGIGIGAFHPQGAAMAAAASGERRRMGMSIFSSSGTLGFSLGPTLIALLVGSAGLDKSYYVVVLGILTSMLLFKYCPPLEVAPKSYGAPEDSFSQMLRAVWAHLILLYFITVLRSGTQILTSNYLPFILKEQGYSVQGIGGALTAFLLCVGLGSFSAGMLAERLSGRSVTLFSGVITVPLFIGAFASQGYWTIIFVAAAGIALGSTLALNIAMAQELLPRQTSTVSALMMGFAWGVGALIPPLAEPLAQAFSFRQVLLFATPALSLAGVLLAYFLPDQSKRQTKIPEKRIVAAKLSAAGD